MPENNKTVRIRLGDGFAKLAGLLVLMVVVVAPWYYGGTRIEGIWAIGATLSVAGIVGVLAFVFQGRLPRVPLACWGTACVLILLAWALVPRAESLYLTGPVLEAVLWNLDRWPGSTTYRPPAAMALLACGVLSAIVIVADLSRHDRWRRSFVIAMGATGALVAAFGIVQSIAGADGIFWQRPFGDQRDVMPENFFATFFHHSVAGAFINLAWALAAGLFLICIARSGGGGWRRFALSLFWGACVAVSLLATLVNVSKAALALAVLILLLFSFWPGRRLLKAASARQKKIWAGATVLLLIAGAAVLSQTDRTLAAPERWQTWFSTAAALPGEIARTGGVPTEPPFDRFAGAAVATEMIREGGFWGFGPGAWMRTYPVFAGEKMSEPFWLWMQFAHQDYLQTIVEWGWAGAFLWGWLAIIGLRRGLRTFLWIKEDDGNPDAILLYSILISLAVLLLHAMVDFPLQIPAIQVYAAVMLGLVWSAPRWKPAAEQEQTW